MPACGARYVLIVRTETGQVRQVSAQYNEVRDPGPEGRPGRIRSRAMVRCIVDGHPVLHLHRTLEEALGGPFKVLSHQRDIEPQWYVQELGQRS